MAKIVFVPFHWAGDLNISFYLARKLQRRGHQIHYLAPIDVLADIRAQGYEATPLLESIFPEGKILKEREDIAAGRWAGFGEVMREYRATMEALREGALERALEGLGAELLAISSSLPERAVAASRTGLPIVLYSNCLASPWDPRVPPLRSGLIPGRSPLFGLRTRLRWALHLGAIRVASLLWDMPGELIRFGRDIGFPVEQINLRAENAPRLPYPEIILCPPEFDFPRSSAPAGVHFVEPPFDSERKGPPFPWERLDGRPLVYAATGSMASIMHPVKARQFSQAFLDTLAARPQLQGVLSAGRLLDLGSLRIPANVVVVPEAPQLELLKRASLMVSHGGFSSVLESLTLGVPPIVIPLFFDHPGYAARVVYHGLGERVELKKAMRGEALAKAMDRVLNEPGYRERVGALSRRFQQLVEEAPSLRVFEEALAARSSGQREPGPAADALSPAG